MVEPESSVKRKRASTRLAKYRQIKKEKIHEIEVKKEKIHEIEVKLPKTKCAHKPVKLTYTFGLPRSETMPMGLSGHAGGPQSDHNKFEYVTRRLFNMTWNDNME
jgi:hypothetical protein